MAFPDLENLDPEEADTNCCDAHNRAEEKEEYKEEENDVVNWEDFCRHDEYPIHRVENLVVPQHVTAVAFADRILRLVDEREEHADPDKDCHEHQQDSAKQLERAKYSLNLCPGSEKPPLAFSAGFCRQALAANEGPLFPDEGIKFTAVLRR